MHEFPGVSRSQWVGWGRTHLHLSDLLGQGESHGQEPRAVLPNHVYAPNTAENCGLQLVNLSVCFGEMSKREEEESCLYVWVCDI